MSYPLMDVYETARWIPIFENFGISIKARSPTGFLTNYLKYGSDVLNKTSNEERYTWNKKRNLFLVRTIAAFNKMPTLKRYLTLVAWAYEPDVNDPLLKNDILRVKRLLGSPL